MSVALLWPRAKTADLSGLLLTAQELPVPLADYGQSGIQSMGRPDRSVIEDVEALETRPAECQERKMKWVKSIRSENTYGSRVTGMLDRRTDVSISVFSGETAQDTELLESAVAGQCGHVLVIDHRTDDPYQLISATVLAPPPWMRAFAASTVYEQLWSEWSSRPPVGPPWQSVNFSSRVRVGSLTVQLVATRYATDDSLSWFDPGVRQTFLTILEAQAKKVQVHQRRT
ncbi:hypothetical protein MYK68_03685 [Gordonia sp. PP30]|uniref:hypothetical protein n=1 Tax=Gordonia sp. PP30 TaxID=2935861 RepID=UPI001FFE37AC|nr:hypothetical protein [Gordonia sp. PP30]UQE75731.1 hypothetical protein MYK68_03685 [Gordonia sp. PP30]